MLDNFEEEYDRCASLVREQEIDEFYIVIRQLLKHSDIFKTTKNEEYNIDKLCVNGIKNLTDTLYSINNQNTSIFQLTRNDSFRLRALKHIIGDIDSYWNYIYNLDEAYKRIITSNAKQYAYRGNLKEDIYTLTRDLYSECTIKLSKDEANKFINGTLSNTEILNIKKRTLNFLKANYSAHRKMIIDSKVKIIVNGATFLNKYGHMEYYVNANNTRVKSLNMPYLQTNTRTTGREKPFTCIDDYYNSDILSSLPDEELSAIDVFMINRIEKVKSRIIKALVMITFLSNQTKNNIDDEQWINVYKIPKKEIVEALTRYKIVANYLWNQSRILDKTSNDNNKETEYINNEHLAYRTVDLAGGLTEKFMNDYNDKYNRFEGDNMLREDLLRLVSSDNFQIFYDYKDSLIDVLLNSVISANININWGIVPNDKDGMVDKDGKILLSFDLPGYNAPISCHANLERVINTILNMTADTIIPIYLGNEQLIYDNNVSSSFYSTYIPFKLSKEQKEAVKIASKNSSNDIVKHIAMMQNVLSTTKLKREENKFIDLISFLEERKINPCVKSYK